MYTNKMKQIARVQEQQVAWLHTRQHDESYDQLGPPQGAPSVLADVWETVWNHMTKYNIWTRKNDKGWDTRLAF